MHLSQEMVDQSVSFAELLIEAIVCEPEMFLDIIGVLPEDCNERVVANYLSGMLDIIRGVE